MANAGTVYVDDSDSNIRYGTGWFFHTQSTTADPSGDLPLYGTLHSANVSTEFSYTFSGQFFLFHVFFFPLFDEKSKVHLGLSLYILG